MFKLSVTQFSAVSVSLLAISALGGCTSGGSKSIASAASSAIPPSDFAYEGKALAAGKTLVSQKGMYKAAKIGDGKAVASPSAFSIKKNDKGGYDVKVGDGNAESFTSNDAKTEQSRIVGYAKSNHREFYNYSKFFDELGESQASLWTYYWDAPGGGRLNGYAVTGVEASASAVAAKEATATYTGFARTDAYSKTGGTTARTGFKGDLTMKANFDVDVIGGKIDNIRTRQSQPGGVHGNWYATKGEIVLAPSRIEGNGYAGQAAGIGDDLNNVHGTYTGKFYGADADETAGTLGMEDDKRIFVGGFHGWQ